MKQLLCLGLAVMWIASTNAMADGCFVAPKFVWDKHKDINEPTQKAILIYDAGQEDLILQVKYEGPVDEFGWLVPVPNQPQVKLGTMKCFYELSKYTQQHFDSEGRGQYGGMAIHKGGPTEVEIEPPVKVVEIKTVGAYQIAVLSTKDASALEQWLTANQFYFPANKTDVLDAYVQQHWYFVAVKINLDKVTAAISGTNGKLASGELNPLQISFASGRCVFPLKISSVNGKASEVQVYVLSPEPLLEKAMLASKLPALRSNALVRAAQHAETMRSMENDRNSIMNRRGNRNFLNDDRPSEQELQKMAETPAALPDELLPYAKLEQSDLQQSSKSIARLKGKAWWLTKQTWNFQPDEMRDLSFEPALPCFSDMLATQFGYFAAANLVIFGSNAVPVLLTAFKSPNANVRNYAATISENQPPIIDSQFVEAAVSLLKDSEPHVRLAAVNSLVNNWSPKYIESLIAMSRDPDVEVSRAANRGLNRHRDEDDVKKFIPSIASQLKDDDLHARASAVKLLFNLGELDEVPSQRVSRAVLLSVMNVPDRELIAMAVSQFRDRDMQYHLSDEEVTPFFQNSEPLARMIGLAVLNQNGTSQSVEMALPLLKDPEPAIRMRAGSTLCAMTGQAFAEDQADQWQAWWTANKTNFTILPKVLRPNVRGNLR